MESERSKKKMFHIGNFIKEELHRQQKSPGWLADAINCERPNIYNIFNRQSMDSELIARISIALNINIFAILADSIADEMSHIGSCE